MKQLKAFFERMGTLPMYGVAYNVQGLTEIKYWDQSGKKIVLNHIPEGLEVGRMEHGESSMRRANSHDHHVGERSEDRSARHERSRVEELRQRSLREDAGTPGTHLSRSARQQLQSLAGQGSLVARCGCSLEQHLHSRTRIWSSKR